MHVIKIFLRVKTLDPPCSSSFILVICFFSYMKQCTKLLEIEHDFSTNTRYPKKWIFYSPFYGIRTFMLYPFKATADKSRMPECNRKTAKESRK